MAALLDENGRHDADKESALPERFPPEPQSGAMEYKLHLVEPSDARVEHLTTQMKWRVEEGGGEALYRLGVKDSGEILGLEPPALEKSLQTLSRMADKIGARVRVVRRYRCEGGEKEVVEVTVQEGKGSPQCAHYLEPCVAVLGPVEAGKSTLLGVLTDGQLDNGRGQARLNLLRHRHELVSGRTSSISHGFLGFTKAGEVVNYEKCGSIQEICEASARLVTLIDLAGHRKYLKTTVFGLTAYQPELAMLVVGTDTQIDEPTCDQVCFSIALGMPLFVVVTKVDKASQEQVAQTTQAIFSNLLTEKGKMAFPVHTETDVSIAVQNFREGRVTPVFLISCVTGQNLQLLQRFLSLIPRETSHHRHSLLSQQPAEFHVDELFNVEGVGLVLGGILKRGVVKEGECLLIGPNSRGEFTSTIVRSIRYRINRAPSQQIVARQAATITVSGVDRGSVRKGTVLLSEAALDEAAHSCYEFEVELQLLESSSTTGLHRGFQATVYVASIMQNAVIDNIHNRECLLRGGKASVRCRFLHHPEFLRVGDRLVMREGPTKASGEVSKLLPLKQATPTHPGSHKHSS